MKNAVASRYLFNGSHCVLPIDCPFSPKVCPDMNSEVVQCSTYCEKSCSNPDVNTCPDGLLCDSGCLCKRGYYRNSVGNCVLPEKCTICGLNMVRLSANNTHKFEVYEKIKLIVTHWITKFFMVSLKL